MPVPFTGTISFKEISRTYSNGFLVRETNENGYSTYTYDGEYLAEKRTHNVDGSTSRTDYAYATTGRDVYLFKEWERTTEAVNDGKKHFEGHEYFLQSNTVELTPRLLRQTIKMVRWYG